jgi:surface antigen
MTRRPTLFLLAGIGISLSFGAHAQINPFHSSRNTGLSNSDFQAMSVAAQALAADPNVTDGTSKSWTNPRTGSHGDVTARNQFQSHGYDCRRVDYSAQTKGLREPRTLSLGWCKTPNGWRML